MSPINEHINNHQHHQGYIFCGQEEKNWSERRNELPREDFNTKRGTQTKSTKQCPTIWPVLVGGTKECQQHNLCAPMGKKGTQQNEAYKKNHKNQV